MRPQKDAKKYHSQFAKKAALWHIKITKKKLLKFNENKKSHHNKIITNKRNETSAEHNLSSQLRGHSKREPATLRGIPTLAGVNPSRNRPTSIQPRLKGKKKPFPSLR